VDNWFQVKGRGARRLEDQLLGLDQLFQVAHGVVLDLGCAEGLIGKTMLESGCDMLHGVEIVPERIERAERFLRHYPAEFWVHDLEKMDSLVPQLRIKYDVVLALSIAHKLRRPEQFIRAAAGLSDDLFAIRLPQPVICDKRSGRVPLDVPKLMSDIGFDAVSEHRGFLDEWIGIYRR
jgi:hypothetical protein